MNYPLIHTESGKTFNSWNDLRLWLVQTHSIARPEDATDLPQILGQLGVVDYVPPDPVPPAPAIPQTIRMAQAEQYLYSQGLLTAVLDAVASMGELAQIRYRREVNCNRYDELVLAIQQLFGWTDAKMDTMFTEASLL